MSAGMGMVVALGDDEEGVDVEFLVEGADEGAEGGDAGGDDDKGGFDSAGRC